MTRLTSLSRSLTAKVVVVTGAASGIGRATAHLLGDEGARVGLVDRDERRLQVVAKELMSAGAPVSLVAIDITAPGAADAVASQIRSALGPIDGLVNNAGVSRHVHVEDANFDDVWATTLAINLTAQAAFIRAALPDLRRERAGRIVNVASTEALGGMAHNSAYTASKHGVVGLTRAMAVELGTDGVTVNCVCPGPIHTGMTAVISDEHKDVFARRRTALRRYGEPEEVAHATLSLLLPAASYITGAVLAVDGGLTARSA